MKGFKLSKDCFHQRQNKSSASNHLLVLCREFKEGEGHLKGFGDGEESERKKEKRTEQTKVVKRQRK